MVINQGDVFWVDLGEPAESEPAYRYPHFEYSSSKRPAD